MSSGRSRTPDAGNAVQQVLSVVDSTLDGRGLLPPEAPTVLMVSGGSDSTALAYVAAELRRQGRLGPATILHVNHQLRGSASDGDAQFVEALARACGFSCSVVSVDVARRAAEEGANLEAVARTVRYEAARRALADLEAAQGAAAGSGRIAVAHTLDDRMEAFYMRSIVGTGPGGFRAMDYRNGQVVRPLLDLVRADLRSYVESVGTVRDAAGSLWREDATNAHTDRFRAYVRHSIVPRAKEWNPALPAVMRRTMNLVAEEDDMVEAMAADLEGRATLVEASAAPNPHPSGERASGARRLNGDAAPNPAGVTTAGMAADAPPSDGVHAAAAAAVEPCSAAASQPAAIILLPEFGNAPRPLQRRVVRRVLQRFLGPESRVESRSVEAVLEGFDQGIPRGGYVTNIQGNLAVSANRRGVRIEPMPLFRARRKRLQP